MLELTFGVPITNYRNWFIFVFLFNLFKESFHEKVRESTDTDTDTYIVYCTWNARRMIYLIFPSYLETHSNEREIQIIYSQIPVPIPIPDPGYRQNQTHKLDRHMQIEVFRMVENRKRSIWTKIYTPNEGLEPSTTSLKGWRSTDWASPVSEYLTTRSLRHSHHSVARTCMQAVSNT